MASKLNLAVNYLLRFLNGNSRDYYLSIGANKSRFRALFAIFDILGPKKVHLVDLLGHLLSRNHVSNFSDLGPPPPLRTWI